MRNCIGVRSCTSSMMMCPYRRISSVSSMRPLLRGRGPIHDNTSSSSATSLSAQCTSVSDSLRSRTSNGHSCSLSTSCAAERTSAREPNKSCSTSPGLSTGHMRIMAARNSGMSRRLSRNASRSISSRLLVAAIASTTSVSTQRAAALWRR